MSSLYDPWVTPFGTTAAGTYTTLTSVDNSLVCFPSDAFHEVCPVHCESDAFSDRRFTVTIWVRAGQGPAQVDGTVAPP